MTSTDQKTVLGRPVTGEKPEPYGYKAEQWPTEKFLPLLDAVLDVPGVEAVQWHAHVPSFNDGDPCTYTLGEAKIRLVGDDEGGDDEDGWYCSYGLDEEHPARPAFKQFANDLDHFEDFLEEAFGEPVEVTATKEGFNIGYYEGGY